LKLYVSTTSSARRSTPSSSFKDWGQRCRCRAGGDPVWCGHLLPTILNQLSKSTPFRSDPRAKEG
jgi:hypothetical protein